MESLRECMESLSSIESLRECMESMSWCLELLICIQLIFWTCSDDSMQIAMYPFPVSTTEIRLTCAFGTHFKASSVTAGVYVLFYHLAMT